MQKGITNVCGVPEGLVDSSGRLWSSLRTVKENGKGYVRKKSLKRWSTASVTGNRRTTDVRTRRSPTRNNWIRIRVAPNRIFGANIRFRQTYENQNDPKIIVKVRLRYRFRTDDANSRPHRRVVLNSIITGGNVEFYLYLFVKTGNVSTNSSKSKRIYRVLKS